jgi:hypothetical protein
MAALQSTAGAANQTQAVPTLAPNKTNQMHVVAVASAKPDGRAPGQAAATQEAACIGMDHPDALFALQCFVSFALRLAGVREDSDWVRLYAVLFFPFIVLSHSFSRSNLILISVVSTLFPPGLCSQIYAGQNVRVPRALYFFYIVFSVSQPNLNFNSSWSSIFFLQYTVFAGRNGRRCRHGA